MFSFPTLLPIIFDGEFFLGFCFWFFFWLLFGWFFLWLAWFGFLLFRATAFLCAVCASRFPFLKQPGLRDRCPRPGVSLAGSLRRLRQENLAGPLHLSHLLPSALQVVTSTLISSRAPKPLPINRKAPKGRSRQG